MSILGQNVTGTTIEKGRITDVDTKTWTVSVATEFTKKPLTGIGFAVPYVHHRMGEGIYFMPEVGSICWICFYDTASRPFVLSWMPMQDESNFRARRPSLNPGDIYMGTRDQNFMVLRRGGVVQIGSSPLAQRIYIPIDNVIRDICQTYNLNCLGGDLSWTAGNSQSNPNGDQPALFTLNAREFAADPNPIASLQIGSQGQGSETILSLTVNASGEAGAATQVQLLLGKDGSVKWTTQSDVSWDVTGDFDVSTTGQINLSATGSASVSGETVSIYGNSGVTVDGGVSTVDVSSPSAINLSAPITNVGAATFPVCLVSPDFEAWIASVTASINIMVGAFNGAMPGSPVLAVPGTTPATPPVLNVAINLISG